MTVRTRLFALLATGLLACTGGDHVASDHQALIDGTGLQTTNTSMPLGTGYNTSTDEKRGRCVELVKAAACGADTPEFELGDQTGNFELELVSSRKELKDKLGLSANVSIRYKLIEGSGSLNIETESEFTSSTITYLLKGEEAFWADLNKAYTPTLSQDAYNALNKPTVPIPALFFQKCGDGWVEGNQRGAQFYALLTIETGSKSNRDAIKGKIEGSVGAGPLKIGGEAAIDMVKTATQSGAKIKLTMRARGFNWLGVTAGDDLVKEQLGNVVKEDTLTKFAEIRKAMQQSIANDRCLLLNHKRAVMTAPADGKGNPVWGCSDEGAAALGPFAALLRMHVNDYGVVDKLPPFTETWNPLANYVAGLAQAKTYIAQLQFLEDALYSVYFDEIRPYQKAVRDRRKEYGLAPPLVVPGPTAPGALEGLNKIVDEAAAVFAPPGGRAFERVRSARLSCLAGISSATFTHCTKPANTPEAKGNRWIAEREPYRESWHDLFNYRERTRVLPAQLIAGPQLVTHADAVRDCAALAGAPRLITADEIVRAVLRLVGANGEIRQNSGWYLQPPPDDLRACPRAWYTDAQKRLYVKPVLVRGPTGETLADCWPAVETARMLCVPQGGMFDGYGEPLQGLMQPPPRVDAIVPVAPTAQIPEPFVPADTRVTLFFTTPLQPGTVTATSVKLSLGGAKVDADVAYVDRGVGGQLEIIPRQRLAPGKEYTVDVTPEVTNKTGDAMLAPFQSKFRVTNVVKTITPAADLAGVALTSKIDVVFSAPVNGETVNAQTFKVFRGTEAVAGTVTYKADTGTATFTPTQALAPSASYRVAIADVRDATSFTTVAPWQSWFTTGAVIESVAPGVDATDVGLQIGVSARYSGEVSADVPVGAVTLKQGTVAVPGTVTRNLLDTVFFTADRNLEPNTTYTATFTTAVTDRAGKPVLTSKTWSFTTGAAR